MPADFHDLRRLVPPSLDFPVTTEICQRCGHYARLSGQYGRSFGACSSHESPHGGRLVFATGACGAFAARGEESLDDFALCLRVITAQPVRAACDHDFFLGMERGEAAVRLATLLASTSATDQ